MTNKCSCHGGNSLTPASGELMSTRQNSNMEAQETQTLYESRSVQMYETYACRLELMSLMQLIKRSEIDYR